MNDMIKMQAFEAAVQQALPVFKPRWWHRADRLDARPVIWSLQNRPQDWQAQGEYIILHTPSQHRFWVSRMARFANCSLWDANCSCTSSERRFQPFQQGALYRAFANWRGLQSSLYNPAEFAAHFVC